LGPEAGSSGGENVVTDQKIWGGFESALKSTKFLGGGRRDPLSREGNARSYKS